MPRSIADLTRHAIVCFDRDIASIRWLGEELPVARELFALRTDDDPAQMNALRAGFGIHCVRLLFDHLTAALKAYKALV